MTGIASVDERYKKYITALDGSIKRDVDASNATHKSQADTLTALYEGQMAESGAEYDDLERQNAVQKLINERDVAENMANLGLTDSGLNRTQQTAVQLSAANNSAKIAREKQAMYNAFKRELTSRLADNEASRASAEASIRSGYEKQAMDAAVSSYNTDVDAWQKNYEAGLKAAQEAAEKAAKVQEEAEAKKNFLYTLRREDLESGTNVFVGSDGKEIKVAKGINPYTGYNNATGNNDTAKAYKSYGSFSNGYQPKGVYVNGTAYGSVKSAGKFDAADGRKDVNVWVTKDNGKHYWLWDGKLNKYVEVAYDTKTGEIREIN